MDRFLRLFNVLLLSLDPLLRLRHFQFRRLHLDAEPLLRFQPHVPRLYMINRGLFRAGTGREPVEDRVRQLKSDAQRIRPEILVEVERVVLRLGLVGAKQAQGREVIRSLDTDLHFEKGLAQLESGDHRIVGDRVPAGLFQHAGSDFFEREFSADFYICLQRDRKERLERIPRQEEIVLRRDQARFRVRELDFRPQKIIFRRVPVVILGPDILAVCPDDVQPLPVRFHQLRTEENAVVRPLHSEGHILCRGAVRFAGVIAICMCDIESHPDFPVVQRLGDTRTERVCVAGTEREDLRLIGRIEDIVRGKEQHLRLYVPDVLSADPDQRERTGPRLVDLGFRPVPFLLRHHHIAVLLQRKCDRFVERQHHPISADRGGVSAGERL